MGRKRSGSVLVLFPSLCRSSLEWGVSNGTFYMSAFHPESSRVWYAIIIPSLSPLGVDSTRIDCPSTAGCGASCLQEIERVTVH